MKQVILLEISHHGYGHATQAGLVINEFIKSNHGAEIELIVVSAVPEWYLRERIDFPFKYIQESVDPGLTMKNILDVDLEKSWQLYQRQSLHWEELVFAKMKLLRDLKINLVLTNVSYIALEAASKLNIPCIAFSSLHWVQVIESYFAHQIDFSNIKAQILSAYNLSDPFVELLPNEPLQGLQRTCRLGPIAKTGVNQRAALNALEPSFIGRRIGLVSLGGGSYPMDLLNWSSNEVSLLVPDNAVIEAGSHVHYSSKYSISFSDLLQSCDFVVAKPGYGMFSEIAFAHKPCFYVQRENWPEQNALISWLERYVATCPVSALDIRTGNYNLSKLKNPVDPVSELISEEKKVVQIIREAIRIQSKPARLKN